LYSYIEKLALLDEVVIRTQNSIDSSTTNYMQKSCKNSALYGFMRHFKKLQALICLHEMQMNPELQKRY